MTERPSGTASLKPERQTCDILVKNGFVLTMDDSRRIYASGAIAITGRYIAAVGPEHEILAAWQGRRVLDAGGAPVHPGYLETHLHIVHGTCRGVLEDMAGGSRQNVNFADWKADVTSEDEHVATQLGCLELLQHGFTAFVEPGTVFDSDSVAAAVESIGIRAQLAGCYLWDQTEIMHYLGGLESQSLYDRVPPTRDRCLAQLGAELSRNDDPDALVRGYVSLYGIGTASDEVLKAAKALADEHRVVMHQHESYTPSSAKADRERLGRSRISHLADLGVLGENTTLIHMNVVPDEDVPPLVELGTSIVWCPFSSLSMGMSDETRCRLPELYRQGVNVALGTDGARESTVGAAALAAYLAAQSARDPITAGNLLEMMTINAARAAGLADLTGSLEPGKRADLVIRNRDAAAAWPGTNVVHQLAFQYGAGSVDTVLVDGQVVLRSGRSTRVEERSIYQEAQASVQGRMKRLGLAEHCEWPVHR